MTGIQVTRPEGWRREEEAGHIREATATTAAAMSRGWIALKEPKVEEKAATKVDCFELRKGTFVCQPHQSTIFKFASIADLNYAYITDLGQFVLFFFPHFFIQHYHYG